MREDCVAYRKAPFLAGAPEKNVEVGSRAAKINFLVDLEEIGENLNNLHF
jgi:hypothetical protein